MTYIKNFHKIPPQNCIDISFQESFNYVVEIIGKNKWEDAKKFKINSPIKNKKDTNWAQTTKIIGINPRIVNTYWGIVKYAISFPENGIHLMPLFETGDGSLYVQNSWLLNDEFLDKDLANLGFPTPEKQLKFVVNILHALGKIVGFDALAHVDNFAEIVILNPTYFEWIKLSTDKKTQDNSIETEELGKQIENLIISKYNLETNFYSLPENKKRELLFPEKSKRFQKRMEIRNTIRNAGYEPIPVVEHAPMRPINFEKIEYGPNDDWAIFTVKDKSEQAKIIGSNTPYKFYEIKNGYPVKNTFDEKVLNYFIDNIYKFQEEYNFDFLRADMAHNQTSHSHSGNKDLKCPEMWAILKDKIQKNKPYFATFAEAFWGNYYISGIQDMVNKKFDIVLGQNNFLYMNEQYIETIKQAIEFKEKYRMFPSLTIFTNDGDLPVHDNLYKSQEANECRYFISIFLNLPSYMGMGFEIKNTEPQSEQEYSNIYVKKQPKDFIFGSNYDLFNTISEMRTLYSNIKDIINDKKNIIITNSTNEKSLSWYYQIDQNQYLLFACNLNPDETTISIDIKNTIDVELIYTNSKYTEIEIDYSDSNNFKIKNFYIGECVVYNIITKD